METVRRFPGQVQRWLAACIPELPATLVNAQKIKHSSEREVWGCRFEIGGTDTAAILSIFKAGSLESVNTSLPPGAAAQKCALAMRELPALGIPTPQVLGYATEEVEAAVVTERIVPVQWTPHARIRAATILARIHTLEEHALSQTLQELVRESDPRECRTTGGQGPTAAVRTLVHGDYFSTNLLPVADGLFVIDWETFGWGDPMWDLGFLLGADPGLEEDEVEAVIAQYGSGATVDRQRLMWHKRRWDGFWQQPNRPASHRRKSALDGDPP